MSETKQTSEVKDERLFKLDAKKRTYNEIVNDLYKPIPDRYIKTKPQGRIEIKYLSWHDAIKFMELYAPGWKYEVTKIENFGDWLFLTVRVWIVASDGEFFREATGCEKLDKEGWGDPSSNAESMALRRALAKFGLGLGLYDGDSSTTQNTPSSNQRQSTSSGQPATSQSKPSGMATDKQIKYLSDLCLAKNLSEIDICLEYSGDSVEVFDNLSFDQISKAITAVKER